MTSLEADLGGHSWLRPEGQGFTRYYRTLAAHRWLVVICTLLAVVAAGAYVGVVPRTYSARAQMLVQPVAAASTTLFGLPLLQSSGDPTRDVLTAASLITTPRVAMAVINALHLRTSANALLQAVQVTPLGQSSFVSVQATEASAGQAQAIANAFAQQVVTTRTETLHAALSRAIPALRAQVAAIAPADRNGPGTLGDRLGQLQQLQQSPDPTISIAASAQLPTSPSSPNTKLSLAAGLFGGLIIGIAAAFGVHALDPRLRREEQIGDLLGLPVLARIPREQAGASPGPMVPGEMSFAALEGYRTLRTILASRAEREPRAYLVTGSSPGEGKSTSAINLAAALGHGGARVILIEADMRRPTFAATLGLRVDCGTEDVLIGEAEPDEALAHVRFDGTPLRVMATRGGGAGLADRLSFAVADRLITRTKQMADFVIIDSPPLTEVIDALPLARLADEVVVIARLGLSRLSKLRDLHDMLANQGSPASGVVLVGESPARSGYSYYADPNDEPPRGRRGSLEGANQVRAETP